MTDVFEAVVRDHRPFLRRAAVAAAREIGLFAALARPASVAATAARLDVAPRRLAALVDVLVLEGLLDRRGAQVAAAAPPPSGAAAEPLPREGWGRLAEVLRTDRPLAPPAPEGEAAARYQDHLVAVGAAPARELAARVVTADVRRVLDVGCGAGTYAAACLAARDDVTATLVDAPAVLDRARAHLGAAGARATFVAGDALTLPLADGRGEGHELALLVNVIHLHDAPTCAALVRRAAAALAPGGRLVVKDLAVAADRSGPPAALYFALDMALYTAGGDVHPEAAVRGWLAAAGLTAVERVALVRSPGSLVLAARRPTP